ncbi:MAG: hypothetical protein GF383_12930 [Candidatus Lokiarchaeota archaeon]|nr:hypothetical protein [Candidatus Lokiarchaeota archaeon]MBD3341990.1 hypothetical protein [Candidatus Lokiarchaeota archaeon]
MLYQLIFKTESQYQYLINAIIVIIGRSLDILSTRYVTKELKLETNKIARKLGWKGMVLIQIPLIILGSLDLYFAFFIFVWSLFLFANNVQGSWYINEIGEETYREGIKETAKNTKSWKIFLSEFSYVFSFTIIGILILIFILVFNDLIAVFFISLALILQGILGTFRSLKYVFELRREDEETPKEKYQS